MTDAVKALIDLIRQDKRTTWMAGLCIALYGAGESLRSSGLEPWGSIVIGLGGMVAAAALLVAKFATKQPTPELAPAPQPSAEPAPPTEQPPPQAGP